MRSAQSRLGVVTSLSAAYKDAGRCVELLPVPGQVLRLGGGVAAGFAGLMLLRALRPSRRRPAAVAAAAAPAQPAPSRPGMSHYLLSQTMALLLIPLCRHYLLGESSPVANRVAPVLERLFKKGS